MTSFLNKIIFALAGKPAGVSKNAVKLSQNRTEDELQLKAMPMHKRLQWLQGRYDAAVTDENNKRHWAWADWKSADLDGNFEVRRIIRIRARYEAQNNAYARGIAQTVSEDTIGAGVKLQLDGDTASETEAAFALWADEIGLMEKMKLARYTKLIDGEAFLVLTTNPEIDNLVKLNVVLIDADRVTDSIDYYDATNITDGIRLDKHGNPVSYHVLNRHPTESVHDTSGTNVPAAEMIHLFTTFRPSQHRGVSELAPCLDLFGQLRDYTNAVLTAAQTAASLTGAIETDQPPIGEEDEVTVEPMEEIKLTPGTILTMPKGYKLNMTDAKQPSSTYAAFKQEILSEIARCLQVPYNIAAGNSNNASYASSRLDWQMYHKAIESEQKRFARALTKIYRAWAREWSIATRRTAPAKPRWIFPGVVEHSDPAKAANANATALATRTTNLATIFAEQGKDWEEELLQFAREQKLMKQLGIDPVAPIPKKTPNPPPDNQGEGEDEGEGGNKAGDE